MKEKLMLITILLSLGIASCKKKHNITIQAQDMITGDGSAYADMTFTVLEARTGTFEDKYETAYEGVLDNNGYASFDLKMNKNRNYLLFVSQPDNICYGGIFKYYLDTESSNVVPIDYLKCGVVNIPLENVNCEGAEDEFRYKFYHSLGTDIYIYI